MHGRKVLLIDDDLPVLNMLEHTFLLAGAQVYAATNGHDALRLLFAQRPDLVILDVMMPDMDGWEVCARIRELSDVPIIFVSALGAEEDIVRALDSGAVDYVIKPFSLLVLLARARVALRRAERVAPAERPLTYRDDYLVIDLEQRQVLVRGQPVELTAIEFRLLAYLLQNAGWVLTFQQILEHVWGWECRDNVEYVHVYVWHLRKKLEEDPKNPCYLLTEHGVGYRFQKLPLNQPAW